MSDISVPFIFCFFGYYAKAFPLSFRWTSLALIFYSCLKRMLFKFQLYMAKTFLKWMNLFYENNVLRCVHPLLVTRFFPVLLQRTKNKFKTCSSVCRSKFLLLNYCKLITFYSELLKIRVSQVTQTKAPQVTKQLNKHYWSIKEAKPK